MLSGRKLVAGILAVLVAIPYSIDLFGIEFSGFNVESAFWFLTHVYLAGVIIKSLRIIDDISHTEIIDAVSVYLTVGLGFANLYGMILFHQPDALLASNASKVTYDLVLYYSFVTQATVGYGDLVPNTRLLRTLSVIQAIFGVMFVAVTIARFVAIYSATEIATNRDNGGN